jgi:Lipocalin-like domain
MKVKKFALSSLAFVSVLASASASAQDIVGSWKQTAFYQKVVSSGEKRFPFGEKIVGRSVYTKEGTFCTMATGIDRTQGAGAPTDEERLKLFRTMYAYCGTYRVDGSKFMGQPDVAWTPNWTKQEHNASWKVDGKVLTIETLPFKSQLDGVDVVAVVEYEKE